MGLMGYGQLLAGCKLLPLAVGQMCEGLAVCCAWMAFTLLFCCFRFLQDDMAHFHGTYKKVCDKHDPEYYAKFKKVGGLAEYFFSLRAEPRVRVLDLKGG